MSARVVCSQKLSNQKSLQTSNSSTIIDFENEKEKENKKNGRKNKFSGRKEFKF